MVFFFELQKDGKDWGGEEEEGGEKEKRGREEEGTLEFAARYYFGGIKTEARMINRINMTGRGEAAPELLHPFPIPQ